MCVKRFSRAPALLSAFLTFPVGLLLDILRNLSPIRRIPFLIHGHAVHLLRICVPCSSYIVTRGRIVRFLDTYTLDSHSYFHGAGRIRIRYKILDCSRLFPCKFRMVRTCCPSFPPYKLGCLLTLSCAYEAHGLASLLRGYRFQMLRAYL